MREEAAKKQAWSENTLPYVPFNGRAIRESLVVQQ